MGSRGGKYPFQLDTINARFLIDLGLKAVFILHGTIKGDISCQIG